MKYALALLVPVLLVLVTGCGSTRSNSTSPDPGPDEAVASAGLEGTEWRLVDVGGKAAIPGLGTRTASISFDAQAASVRGNSGLNSFFGPYAVDGTKLRIENLAMTRMAGSPELMAQESAFTAALHAVRGWRVMGDVLELLDAAGLTTARLRARR